jgi:glycosyltransferase involved in cell wall biosynthesis
MSANVFVGSAFLDLLCRRNQFKRIWPHWIIPNGVDPARLDGEISTLKHELRIDESVIVFGMVGNFARWKDQLTICEALPTVFNQVPGAHFVFVGESVGGSRKMAECQSICREGGIASRVHFLGSRRDIPNIFRSFDCAVFSSFEDTFGLSVIEAMFLGVPVVISDIAPFLEVTDCGKRATVFKTGEKMDLACKLILVARSIGARKRIAKDSVNWALENYGIDAHLQRLVLLYRTLLSSPKHTSAIGSQEAD